ncbi:MAG: hypothetical protein ABIS51_09315 [Sphingomonas sp.]
MVAVQPGTAHAQIWIGLMVGDMISQQQGALREQACMNGTPQPDNEIAEARRPALSAMTGYFEAAKGGGAPLSSQFHLDKRSLWISGSVRAGMAEIDHQSDPFARDGLALDTASISFVRSGDGSSALGQWTVRDASGAKMGTYTGVFARKMGVWRLSTLELTPARVYVDPVVQYCHKPGDVLPYRVSSTTLWREVAEKRLAKATAKAEKAEQAAAAARAKADKSPSNASAQAALNEAVARAKNLADQLAMRRSELGGAQAMEASALEDAKAAEDAKVAAMAALDSAR